MRLTSWFSNGNYPWSQCPLEIFSRRMPNPFMSVPTQDLTMSLLIWSIAGGSSRDTFSLGQWSLRSLRYLGLSLWFFLRQTTSGGEGLFWLMVSEVLVQRIHCHGPEARLNASAGSITGANHHKTDRRDRPQWLSPKATWNDMLGLIHIWPSIHRIQSSLQLTK